MPTRAAEPDGLATTAREAAAHASALARLEVKLAALELKRKAGAFGFVAGAAAGLAILGFFALAFLFAAVGAALALALPIWAALLLTAVICLVLAVPLGFLLLRSLRRASPPVPEQAVREARLTAEAMRDDARR